MNKTLVSVIAVLAASSSLLAGCSAADVASGEQVSTPAGEGATAEYAQPLIEFEAKGHLVRAYELKAGALALGERHNGEEAALADLPEAMKLSEIYTRFNSGPVPEAILQFEERAELAANEDFDPEAEAADLAQTPDGAPKFAAPGLGLKFEGGPEHFRQDHCPSVPGPYDYSNLVPNPIAVRLFCWADGHIGNWTETGNARVAKIHVASAAGTTNVTLQGEGINQTFPVFNLEQWDWVWRNGTYWDRSGCRPWPIACSPPLKIRQQTMNATVQPDSGGVWRFGGGFWR